MRYALVSFVLLAVGLLPAWTLTPEEEAKLLASDGQAGDLLGSAVDVDNDTAVIGAPRTNGTGLSSGSVYVFTLIDGLWTEQAKLMASDPVDYHGFGRAVALDGDTVVLGVSGDDDNGEDSGAAYVFTRSSGMWTQQAKLSPADGNSRDLFGYSVALDGDTTVIGAYEDHDNGSWAGSAYVFTRTGSSWTEQAELLASDGFPGDHFGISVALDGNTVVIGAHDDDYSRGSAYVFTRTGSTWTQQAKLQAADGTYNEDFGWSVAVDGDTALIGAASDDNSGSLSGSAYIFTRTGSAWTEQAKLVSADAAAADRFGWSVALHGDTALIGTLGNNDYTGSAYVFTGTGSTWTEQAELLASDGTPGDHFGRSVAADDDIVVIGVSGDGDNGYSSGSAHVFRLRCRLSVTKDASHAVIFFSPASSGFDLVAGRLSQLFADHDFSRARCLGSHSAGDPAVDWVPGPPAGDGRYYLARGHTSFVDAGYGDSSLVPDPRDDLDASGPCP